MDPDGKKAPYVSAGVALALLQYVRATHNTRLISNTSFGDLLADISNFLVSQAHLEDDKNYSIRGTSLLNMLLCAVYCDK